jgi:transposase
VSFYEFLPNSTKFYEFLRNSHTHTNTWKYTYKHLEILENWKFSSFTDFVTTSNTYNDIETSFYFFNLNFSIRNSLESTWSINFAFSLKIHDGKRRGGWQCYFIWRRTRLPAILPGTPGRIFLWDNLRSHYNGQVARAIYATGHTIIPRPPYAPEDGPIEFIFNYIENMLQQRCYLIKTLLDLEWHIFDIIATITPQQITNTFIHCGY